MCHTELALGRELNLMTYMSGILTLLVMEPLLKAELSFCNHDVNRLPFVSLQEVPLKPTAHPCGQLPATLQGPSSAQLHISLQE